ncbi:MAG: alpha/beta fold hydrolase, partial [Hyphomicrobiaceae bacterium]
GKQTFAFVNALTGSTEQWEAGIAPALRDHGYGTLSYNFRGQVNTAFTADDPLDEAQIIADLKTVLEARASDSTILVGLSIGGLLAARAILSGSPAVGLVLINTLRQPDLTLEWTNEAIYRAARLGGSQLVMDMFLPGLVGPKKLSELRANCLGDADYEPLPKDSGILRLIEKSRATGWDLPYEKLNLPVLVMTGLRDRVFLNRDVVSNLVERLPKPYHVEFPEAGHLIPAEDPDAVVDVLKRFAEDLSRN